MRDEFFTKKYCDRCGKSLDGGRIMSMYNEDCICMECKEKETKRADYKEAVRKDTEEYLKKYKINVEYGEKSDTKNKKV